MLTRERLQKTSGGLRKRKLPTINRDTLHFVSAIVYCFQYHKTLVEVEFRELLFEVGKRGERQRSTTENKSTCYERLKKGTWATLVGEERSLPFWQKLRCFTTNIIKWHWLKIKILQHFNPEQEVFRTLYSNPLTGSRVGLGTPPWFRIWSKITHYFIPRWVPNHKCYWNFLTSD